MFTISPIFPLRKDRFAGTERHHFEMNKELRITGEDVEYFKRNRDLAYRGKSGRQRRDFSISYIDNKKKILQRIRREVVDQTEQGMQFTCRKGCSYCCVLYIEASVNECEAIVYYLYNRMDTFFIFLERYPAWRRETGRYGDLLLAGMKARMKLRKEKDNIEANRIELSESMMDYQSLNVSCPFLHNNICTIYEVQPYACATHYVTTPAEWCSPFNLGQPDVYRTQPANDVSDLQLLDRKLGEPVISSMPLTVYEILRGGLSYLSEVTGLNLTEDEVGGSKAIT